MTVVRIATKNNILCIFTYKSTLFGKIDNNQELSTFSPTVGVLATLMTVFSLMKAWLKGRVEKIMRNPADRNQQLPICYFYGAFLRGGQRRLR